jgi:hypothetical protein
MSFSTFKYDDVDVPRRRELRATWNRPVLWPLGALAVLVTARRHRGRAAATMRGGV